MSSEALASAVCVMLPLYTILHRLLVISDAAFCALIHVAGAFLVRSRVNFHTSRISFSLRSLVFRSPSMALFQGGLLTDSLMIREAGRLNDGA